MAETRPFLLLLFGPGTRLMNHVHLFVPGLCCKCPSDDNSDNLQKSSALCYVCVGWITNQDNETQTRGNVKITSCRIPIQRWEEKKTCDSATKTTKQWLRHCPSYSCDSYVMVPLFTETALTLFVWLVGDCTFTFCVCWVCTWTCMCVGTWTISEPLKAIGLYVTQSHSLCCTCFGQCQALSAALEWQGDGDGYLMHRMQSAGLVYTTGRSSPNLVSLCTAVHTHAQSVCWSALVTKSFVHKTIATSFFTSLWVKLILNFNFCWPIQLSCLISITSYM